MDDSPLWQLAALLGLLLAGSAFFSGSETGMMTLDRYRLRHLSQNGHRRARMAKRLLDKPDRLIGLILFGNNLVNFMAASLATLITIRLFGDSPEVMLTMTVVMTAVVLIFAEVTPKTIAALYPEKIAFTVAPLLRALMWPLLPAVLLINRLANGLLRGMGFDPAKAPEWRLGRDELRTLVDSDTSNLPEQHQGMVLNILDLEKATVNDIMVSKNDIYGINLQAGDAVILERIRDSHYTRIVVFDGDLDNILGILHLRHALLFIRNNQLDRARMLSLVKEAYFVPEFTPLHTQLFHFQQEKRRIAIVVDEYGTVIGVVTLEDILEDIVGEFTSEIVGATAEIRPQDDGSYLMEGTVNIRDINRALDWQLPTREAKTLNGLLLEILEGFPDGPVGVRIDGYRFEILDTRAKVIEQVRASRVPAEDSTADDD